jgi:TonB family protein
MFCACLVEVLAIVLVVLLGIIFPQRLPLTNQYVLAWLPALTPPKPPVAQPVRKVPRVIVPQLKTPEVPQLVIPPEPELKPPKVQPVIAAAPIPVPLPPPVFSQPTPPPKPKEQTVVKTGTFGGAPEKVTTKLPAQQVQTGGFGSPEGFRGKAQGDSQGNVPKLGSFGLPEGPGVGNGTGGSHGVQGVVASAGFGSGVAGPGSGNGSGGKVAVGGFGRVSQAAPDPTKAAPVPAPVDFQSIEILYKPTPAYTEDARRLGIQGDVALSVVFQADGTIRVLGVVKSLGHGLDEEAQQVASQIRFKPAKRAGQPADFPATVRIEFRLAGQAG